MEYGLQTQTPLGDFFDQRSSSPFLPNGGNNSVNTGKRGRDSNPTATSAAQQQHSPTNLFSLQPHQHQQQQQISSAIPSPIHVSRIRPQWQQNHHHQRQPNLPVSTGLRLSFPDSQQNNPLHHDDDNLGLSAQIDLQKDEINRLLHAQMEQLRGTLRDMQRKHYNALVTAMEKSTARRMQGKVTELEIATRQNAELEERVSRLMSESEALQAKVRADERMAEALQMQLRHAAMERAASVMDDPAVPDCESACVDPRRERPTERGGLICRRCSSTEASVVLLPCRHLCVCRSCDIAAGGRDVCPVCSCVTIASVEVSLS